MKTRLAVTFLGSLFLVLAVAGPALAGSRGARTYT
jgi:hypothetical protein